MRAVALTKRPGPTPPLEKTKKLTTHTAFLRFLTMRSALFTTLAVLALGVGAIVRSEQGGEGWCVRPGRTLPHGLNDHNARAAKRAQPQKFDLKFFPQPPENQGPRALNLPDTHSAPDTKTHAHTQQASKHEDFVHDIKADFENDIGFFKGVSDEKQSKQ